MANVNVTSEAWTEISITSGTVQNISATADIELSAEQTDNSGVVLKPSEIYQWDNETIYARAVTEDTGALRVVNFKKAAGGGGGYVLPVASASTLGGVKVGSNLSINESGEMSATGGGGASYSTTEQQIGTWIDGNPLYQITIVDTMPTVTTDGTAVTKQVDISALSIKAAISMQGVVFRDDVSQTFNNLDSINSSSPLIQFRFLACTKLNYDNAYLDTLLIRETQLINSNEPCYITLQYTKTTD